MAQSHLLVGHDSRATELVIRRVRAADLGDALTKGLQDFAAMPSHAVFLCVIYPIIGILLAAATLGFDVLPLLYPLAAGFALLGPLAALGLYEMSRRREAGLKVQASDALEVLHSPSLGAVMLLGLGLMLIFLIWIATARAIYVAHFGYAAPASVGQFVQDVLFTPTGWMLIVTGNLAGLFFALIVLLTSVVSFPLLLDRNVGAAGAVLTNVRVLLANPLTMAVWGLIVAGLLLLGSVPMFLGLPVVLPVLGHATWHLYRKAVVPDPDRQIDHRRRRQGQPRYAADFPVVLFPWLRGDRR